MKRLILALITVGSIATSANAQEPKSILWYGEGNLNTVRNDDQSKNTDWKINTGVGYQFNRNWTLGLSIGWDQNAQKSTAGIKSAMNTYYVGPFARYSHYIGRSETFFWFSQLDFNYIGGYSTREADPAFNKHNGVYVGLTPALGINLGRALCLNFNIGGLSYKTDKMTDATYSENTFALNFGRQWNIGISKNFSTGHKMHSHHEPGDEVHHRRNERNDDDDDSAPKPKRKERSRDDDE